MTEDAAYFDLLRGWLTHEMAEVYRSDTLQPAGRGGLLLSFPLFGRAYKERFERYFVESCFSGRNLSALRGRTRLVLFVAEGELSSGMTSLADGLEGRGVSVSLRVIPDRIVAASAERMTMGNARRYPLVSVVHNLAIKMAARCGSGYSMAMPDQVYSELYWERLLLVAERCPAVVQTTISASLLPAAAELDLLRSADGSLSIPARTLGDIALRNIHPQMAGSLANGREDYPRHHFLYWRGRDFMEIAYANGDAAWLSPDLCRRAGTKLWGTIDAELPHFTCGEPCAVPTLDMEMTYVELSDSDKPAVPGRSTPLEYAALAWHCVDWRREYLPFLAAPHRIPVSEAADGEFMEERDIVAAHAELVRFIEEKKDETKRHVRVGVEYRPPPGPVPRSAMDFIRSVHPNA